MVENELKALRDRVRKYEIALEVLKEMEGREPVKKAPKFKRPRTPREDRSVMKEQITKVLTETGSMTIAEIAEALGFPDSSHRTPFYKVISNLFLSGKLVRDADRRYSIKVPQDEAA
jgi:AraC-like DNA-binding protein